MLSIIPLMTIAILPLQNPPTDTAPATDARLLEQVDGFVQALLEQEGVPGLSIAVSREGETVLAKGWGNADGKGSVPASASTLYSIGSLTRQFTAVGILQLVEQGQLALDDELSKLLPRFPVQGKKITLRQLLSGTSGIPSYAAVAGPAQDGKPTEAAAPASKQDAREGTVEKKEKPRSPQGQDARSQTPSSLAAQDPATKKPQGDRPSTQTPKPSTQTPKNEPQDVDDASKQAALDLDAFYALFRDAALEFEPGAGFSDDSAGDLLLGLILEQVSGETHAHYVQTHLLQPLEMKSTGFRTDEKLARSLAEPCKLEAGEQPASTASEPPFGAQAMCSTVSDLLIWRRALDERTLIGEESSRAMETATELAGGKSSGHGYALAIGEVESTAVLMHAGGNSSYRALLAVYPSAKLTIAILANCATAPVEKLERRIARLTLGVPSDELVDLPLEPEAIALYAGNYQIATTMVRIYEKQGRLYYESAQQPAFALQYQGDNVFVSAADKNLRITFQLSEHGSAESFTLTRAGLESTGKRFG